MCCRTASGSAPSTCSTCWTSCAWRGGRGERPCMGRQAPVSVLPEMLSRHSLNDGVRQLCRCLQDRFEGSGQHSSETGGQLIEAQAMCLSLTNNVCRS